MEIIMFIIFIVTNLLSYYVCNLRTHTPINMKMACISMYIFHHLTKKMPK